MNPPRNPANFAVDDATPSTKRPLSAYIRELGRGARGARSLPAEVVEPLFAEILAASIGELELGALLLAWRIKGETPVELAAMLRAAHRCCGSVAPPPGRLPVSIPCYNGARRLPNLTPLLALLLARDGVPVLLHGMTHDPGRVTTAEILTVLGEPPCDTLHDVNRRLAEGRPAFIPLALLNAQLAALLDKRRVLGLRNSGHTVAKLLQPFADHAPSGALRLVNYTHSEYLHSLAELLTTDGANALLARGTEGEAVADVRRQVRIDWLHGGEQQTLIEARSSAIPQEAENPPPLPASTDAETTAAWIRRVLDDELAVPSPIETQRQLICHALGLTEH